VNGTEGRPQLAALWWSLGWAMVLFILYSTLAPSRYVPDLHIWDKLEHATAFFGMTFWFGGLVARRRFWLLGIVMSAFGAAIEVAQGTMGLGRDMDIHDWYADTCGILLALGVLLTCVPRSRGSWLQWVESLIGR
jgi:VanZ family protein